MYYDPAFAENDANIVLQSSGGTIYQLPSFTLRTTSGFFCDMMTLPQHDAGQDWEEAKEASRQSL
jgi:hypothetical protein